MALPPRTTSTRSMLVADRGDGREARSQARLGPQLHRILVRRRRVAPLRGVAVDLQNIGCVRRRTRPRARGRTPPPPAPAPPRPRGGSSETTAPAARGGPPFPSPRASRPARRPGRVSRGRRRRRETTAAATSPPDSPRRRPRGRAPRSPGRGRDRGRPRRFRADRRRRGEGRARSRRSCLSFRYAAGAADSRGCPSPFSPSRGSSRYTRCDESPQPWSAICWRVRPSTYSQRKRRISSGSSAASTRPQTSFWSNLPS